MPETKAPHRTRDPAGVNGARSEGGPAGPPLPIRRTVRYERPLTLEESRPCPRPWTASGRSWSGARS